MTSCHIFLTISKITKKKCFCDLGLSSRFYQTILKNPDFVRVETDFSKKHLSFFRDCNKVLKIKRKPTQGFEDT